MIDHARLLVPLTIVGWIGLTLLLSELRWFQRLPLQQRLLPYRSGSGAGDASPRTQTLREMATPLATTVGERIGGLFGVRGELSIRLQRANIVIDAGTFRMRQLSWAVAAMCLGLLLAIGLELPPLLILGFAIGSPLLAFLVLEQQVITATQRRQRRLFAELPVVAEQLATLLGAGYSLGSALNRLGERNHGVSGDDLRGVCARVRQGLTVARALQEWSERVGLPELDRLVSVLAFSSETTDLGRLVSAEAESMRDEAQRRLAELIDKRAQQVWVPVTVATLVPGVIFLAIPFLHALRQFSSG